MDKNQADAIAQAILQPDRHAQEVLKQKRAGDAWWLREKRKVAWLTLLGLAIGTAVAIYVGERFTIGGLWGSVTGAAAGWIWIGVRRFRRAA